MSARKLPAMREGGAALSRVRDGLQSFTAVGMSFQDIEDEAQRRIKSEGMQPSFSTVEGYSWATCVMRNDALLHGIPSPDVMVEEGDLITIDVGILHQGFHTDTSISFQVGKQTKKIQRFLSGGQAILDQAIQAAQPGSSVWDVSRIMQRSLHKYGWGAVYQMVGHGIGEELHMAPSIPCVASESDKSVIFEEGQTVAIEIMYAMGDPALKQDDDGWTYRTIDGSVSAMFEHTVHITSGGPEILTL